MGNKFGMTSPVFGLPQFPIALCYRADIAYVANKVGKLARDSCLEGINVGGGWIRTDVHGVNINLIIIASYQLSVENHSQCLAACLAVHQPSFHRPSVSARLASWLNTPQNSIHNSFHSDGCHDVRQVPDLWPWTQSSYTSSMSDNNILAWEQPREL